MHPKLHQSDENECVSFLSISGGKYSGVPDIDLEISLSFESPKSVSLIYPNLSIKTFCILI